LWVASRTAQLAAGSIDVTEYMEATSSDRLLEQRTNESHAVAVELGCLDVGAASFSYTATLHRPAACFYSASGFVAALLSMSHVQWLYFLVTCFANLWLILTIFGSIKFQLKWGSLVETASAPLPAYPPVSVLIPCYMPNEQVIIMDTLHAMVQSEYEGELTFYVVYNTPVDLPIEAELKKIKSMNGRKVVCARVPGSHSKAENLEYALTKFCKGVDICVLFDADHHPRPNTIRGLVSLLVATPEVVAVQGAVLIEREGYWPVRKLLDGMEWSSWSFYSPGFGEVVGSAYFGGGNAAWRVETLKALGFDHAMLTEDIDITIRALASGKQMQFAPFLQVGEMCPATFKALYKQRLRWAMGWEQVTMQRITALFASSQISEPQKWRTLLLLISRYMTLFSSSMGIFNLLKTVLFNFYTPSPIQAASAVASGIAMFMYAFLTFVLFRLREPWHRWLSVYIFAAVSLFYFFIQASLIVISIFRLTCCAGRAIIWHPTTRGGKAAPPPAPLKGELKGQ